MRNVILACFLCAGLAGDSGPAASSPLYSRLTVDLGMVVSDLERSVKFYRDDLGLVAATPPGFDVSGELARDAGLTDQKPLRVKVFQLGEGETATRLKLMSFAEAKAGDQSYISSNLGVRYLTFFVKDLDAVAARMKARSIPVLGKGPVALSGGIAIALVRDPDGNFIEFVGPFKGQAAGDEFKRLFNGKDLTGWKPLRNAVWKVGDGTIVGEQGDNFGGGWLVTEKEYGDFDLRFKFRMSKGANSGVGLRFAATDDAAPAKTGYEVQLSEADPQYRSGSVFGIKKAPEGLVKEGEWCEGRIVAKGPRIDTFLNGKEAVSIENPRSARGAIGLQVHGSALYKGMRVEFKEIEIRED